MFLTKKSFLIEAEVNDKNQHRTRISLRMNRLKNNTDCFVPGKTELKKFGISEKAFYCTQSSIVIDGDLLFEDSSQYEFRKWSALISH